MAAADIPAGHVSQHPVGDVIGPKLGALANDTADISRHLGDVASQLKSLTQGVDRATSQLQYIQNAVKPETGFFKQMHAPDWVQVALLFVAILTLWAARGALRESTRARDLENYHKVMAQFDAAWEKYSAAQPQDQFIVFGQLINFYESICDLFNRKYFGAATRDMLRSYLRQMLPILWSNPQTLHWINQSLTAPDTFAHIKAFACAEKLVGVPHK